MTEWSEVVSVYKFHFDKVGRGKFILNISFVVHPSMGDCCVSVVDKTVKSQ